MNRYFAVCMGLLLAAIADLARVVIWRRQHLCYPVTEPCPPEDPRALFVVDQASQGAGARTR